jgi:hypothetical protein
MLRASGNFTPPAGEVGEVAERGDGLGLGDEGADAQGVEEAEVVGVRGGLREGEYLVLLLKCQAALGLEAFHLEVVILQELGDVLASHGLESPTAFA